MLLQKIKQDQLQSRKDKDSIKTALLTTLIGEADSIGKNAGNRESTDEEVIAVIKKFLKNNLEFQKHVEDNNVLVVEKQILNSYLPKQLSEDEIKCILEKEFGAIDKSKKGLIMKFLKENYAGKYDGAIASKVIG